MRKRGNWKEEDRDLDTETKIYLRTERWGDTNVSEKEREKDREGERGKEREGHRERYTYMEGETE